MVSTDASSTKAALTDELVAKVTSPDNGEQTSNRLETDWNPDEMALAAQTIERIAAGWKDRSRAVQMLQALCGLAAGDPDRLNPDLAAENWGFRATDIGEELRRRWPKIPGVNSWADNPETAKAKMNEHWPKLGDIWERQKPTIEDGLRAEGLPVAIALYRDEGGGSGNYTKYGFRIDARAEPGHSASDIDLLRVPQVQYRHQDISGNRLVRWMSDRGLYLGGWGGKVFLSVFLLLLIFTVVWSWLVIVAMGASSSTVAFLKLGLIGGLTIVIFYSLFAWQLRLVANRVAVAPMLLQPWAGDDYLLELRKKDGAKRNTMYLVRYAADCPICGEHGKDAIRVASGRWEFFGRLVGRCDRAPNAHVFSFDHITQTGRFLR